MRVGPAGVVVYRGPSAFDRSPIAVIVTLDSLNPKTGNMAQAWVIRSDVPPHEAIRDGRDRAICGTCVHRSGSELERSCYVVVHFSPLNVWRGFSQGHYPDVTPEYGAELLARRSLRIAAYGDPAAAPFHVWRSLLLGVSSFTGYSHAWRTADQRFRLFLMASVESEGEAEQAHALGWRTFRTRLADEPVREDEIICPASNEGGHRVQCAQCGLCTGQRRPNARSIAIIAHGQRVRWFRDRKAALPA